MYNKVAGGSSQRTYPAESKVPNKNEDYVYLALVNNGQLHGDHIQEPTGCRLSPGRCLDRVRPMSTGTSAESIGRRHRKLLIASGVTNAALLALLLPLGAVCVYLLLTRKFILLPYLFLSGKIKLTLFQINERRTFHSSYILIARCLGHQTRETGTVMLSDVCLQISPKIVKSSHPCKLFGFTAVYNFNSCMYIGQYMSNILMLNY